jgi:hypothetical protein
MLNDKNLNIEQQDLVVVCICDGYDNIKESFKRYATKMGFFDENLLKSKGFMKYDERGGKWTMKTM